MARGPRGGYCGLAGGADGGYGKRGDGREAAWPDAVLGMGPDARLAARAVMGARLRAEASASAHARVEARVLGAVVAAGGPGVLEAVARAGVDPAVMAALDPSARRAVEEAGERWRREAFGRSTFDVGATLVVDADGLDGETASWLSALDGGPFGARRGDGAVAFGLCVVPPGLAVPPGAARLMERAALAGRRAVLVVGLPSGRGRGPSPGGGGGPCPAGRHGRGA